ncbi:MAG: hypothetical protein AAGC49_04865 [Brevundimonas sp.]
MKRSLSYLAVLVVLAAFLVGPTSAASAAPYCGITWGSAAKTAPGLSSAPVTNVRTGRATCYDRLVVDIAGKAGGFRVAYVSQVRAEGSGVAIPTRGGARLQITVHDPAYSPSGTPTYSPPNPRELSNVSGYRTFRQVVWAGSFEGYTDVGLGVRARLPFRAFVLAGPGTGSRLVIDVAHKW